MRTLHHLYWHLGKIFSLKTRIGRYFYDKVALPGHDSASLRRRDEEFKAGKGVTGTELRKRIAKEIKHGKTKSNRL